MTTSQQFVINDEHLVFALKGGPDGGKPQPRAIVPSAAFGGAIISFILCPSELVKVSDARVHNILL